MKSKNVKGLKGTTFVASAHVVSCKKRKEKKI